MPNSALQLYFLTPSLANNAIFIYTPTRFTSSYQLAIDSTHSHCSFRSAIHASLFPSFADGKASSSPFATFPTFTSQLKTSHFHFPQPSWRLK